MQIAIGVAAIAVSARLELPVPGTPVPQSAQTLAVLLVGVAMGPRSGAVVVGAYLALGALGLPVFADGAAGVGHLVGPTAGYLVGFLVAAVWIGWFSRRHELDGLGRTFLAMLVGHAIILSLGWARLAVPLGPVPAFQLGVAPFVLGGIAKSFLGGLVVLGSATGLQYLENR